MNLQEFNSDFFSVEINETLNLFLKKHRSTIEKYKDYFHPYYLEGFDTLFDQDFSPTMLEDKLATVGWTPKLVDGYLTGLNYFEYLNRKEIPVNIRIRPQDQIDFALFPDMVHDIMGHCPLLFNEKYTQMVEEISGFICSLKLEERDHEYLKLHRSSLEKREEIITEIEAAEKDLKENPTSYYYHTNQALWTLEFGMIQNEKHTHAYGAAIVASALEMDHIATGKMPIVQLSESSIKNDVNVSDLQNCLYATKSLEEAKEKIELFPFSTSYQ